MDEEKKYIINIESNVDEYVKQLQAADKAVEDFIKANADLLASQDKSNKDYVKAAATLKVLQTERNNASKNVQTAIKANKAEADSYEKLYQAWKNAQTQLKLMPGAYEVNAQGVRVLSQRYLEQSKVVADAKRSLDAFGKGVADNRLNVGNYSEAIEGALDKFQMMPGPLGQAAGAVKQFGTALKVLAVNPIILVITLLVGALAGLVKIFKSTDKGATELEARMNQLKAVIDVIRQRIIGFTEAVGNIFKGNWKEAGEGMKQTFTGIGEQMRDATSAAYAYTLALDAIEDAEKNYVSTSAENRNKIARLEYTAQDRTKSTAERKKALEEALALGEQEVKAQAEFTRKKLDAGISALANSNRVTEQELLAYIKMTDEERSLADQALQDLYNNNDAKVNDLDALYAQWIDLDTKFYEENKRNISRLTGFEEEERAKRTAAAEKASQAEADAAKKSLDEIREYIQAKAQSEAEWDKFIADKRKSDAEAEIERITADAAAAEEYETLLSERKLAREAINAENRMAIREQENEWKFNLDRDALDRQMQQELAAAEKSGADRQLIAEKYSAARKTLDELEVKSKLGLYGDFAGNLAQIFGENTAIGKAAAVAQAIINTYQSATAAYASLAAVPVVGPALGIAAAGAAVAAGIANVKKIVAVKSGLPGDSGGGSATSLSASVPAQRMTATANKPTVLTQMSQQQLNAQANVPQLTKEDLVSALSSMPTPIVTVEDINAKTIAKNKVEVRATI